MGNSDQTLLAERFRGQAAQAIWLEFQLSDGIALWTVNWLRLRLWRTLRYPSDIASYIGWHLDVSEAFNILVEMVEVGLDGDGFRS